MACFYDAYGDDLENGEEDRRRCHGRWELQHGRDIGSYLGRGDHPVKRIVARAASVLRLMALRAMKNTKLQRLKGRVRHSTTVYILCHSEWRRLTK